MLKKILSVFAAVVITAGCLSSCSESVDSTTEIESTAIHIQSSVKGSDHSASETANTETTTTSNDEKSVPEIIKNTLNQTDPAAAIKNNEHIRYSNNAPGDEMWFQDMDGDGKPDLIIGGSNTTVDYIQSASLRCYDVQLSSGNGGGIIIVFPDYSHKQQYGHASFAMQAYKDKNGTLLFTQDQFHAYTSPDPERDPKYAGAFHKYDYSFTNGRGDNDKNEILCYSYDPKTSSMKDIQNCSDGKGNRITGTAARQLLNNYYSSKTPLRANVKTINYQEYMKQMTQEQRKQALMDSYYAFSYTEDTSIQPYGKDIIEKIVAAEAKATVTTTTKKPQETGGDMYASYAKAVESFKSRNADANGTYDYFVCDIDNDGVQELCVSAMYGIIKTSVEIFKYNVSSKRAERIATGDVAGCISYSLSKKMLISTNSHPCGVTTETPSGTTTDVFKISISGGKLTSTMLFSADSSYAPGEKKLKELGSTTETTSSAKSKSVTASDIKANAVKNKAA